MKELQKIMELLEVTKDIDLAHKLGMKGSSTISTWKKRGEVPEQVLREWSLRYGKPVEWFRGEIEKPQMPEHLRLLHETIDNVLAGKDLADQYSFAGKVLSFIQKENH